MRPPFNELPLLSEQARPLAPAVLPDPQVCAFVVQLELGPLVWASTFECGGSRPEEYLGVPQPDFL
jgi:hypothetical protein